MGAAESLEFALSLAGAAAEVDRVGGGRPLDGRLCPNRRPVEREQREPETGTSVLRSCPSGTVHAVPLEGESLSGCYTPQTLRELVAEFVSAGPQRPVAPSSRWL